MKKQNLSKSTIVFGSSLKTGDLFILVDIQSNSRTVTGTYAGPAYAQIAAPHRTRSYVSHSSPCPAPAPPGDDADEPVCRTLPGPGHQPQQEPAAAERDTAPRL